MLRTTEVICFLVQSVQNFMKVRKVVLKCVRETYLGEDPSVMLEMIFVTEGEIRIMVHKKVLVT